jgi:hypothetical protein
MELNKMKKFIIPILEKWALLLNKLSPLKNYFKKLTLFIAFMLKKVKLKLKFKIGQKLIKPLMNTILFLTLEIKYLTNIISILK